MPKILSDIGPLMVIWLALAAGAADAQEQPNNAGDANGEAATTISYDQEFFRQFPNAITVLDIIQRIPGGQKILNSGGAGRRGFSTNDDRILINGSRLSGKENDSASALGRITLDSVERIELIRGSSPDIKTSSQAAILNIVLKSDDQSSSGSWRLEGKTARTGKTQIGGYLSYGGAVGQLEYFASAQYSPRPLVTKQRELSFDAQDRLFGVLDERIPNSNKPLTLSTNLTYSFHNGDTLHLNGQYSDVDFNSHSFGELFVPDDQGGLISTGRSRRIDTSRDKNWEVGGDLDAGLADSLKLKVIGLYRHLRNRFNQREDFDIVDNAIEDDVLSRFTSLATEKIGRGSLTWNISQAHQVEIGSEFAVNDEKVNLEFFVRNMGVLEPVDVSASDVLVKETRSESFITHDWTINSKMSLESSLFVEYSKLAQRRQDLSRDRHFFFLRPSSDFRYNLTPSDQAQLSIRRTVSQLDFADFASSVTSDDQVQEGNSNLSPEKSWQIEGSFEHRFPNDGGNIKISASHFRFQDKIQLIRTSDPTDENGDGIPDNPGLSGVGNIGNGRETDVGIESNIRLGFVGLPNMVLEPQFGYFQSKIRDPFTGLQRHFNRWNTFYVNLRFRHDLNKIGLSYGGEMNVHAGSFFNDIDERIHYVGSFRADLFLEYQIIRGVTLKLEGLNLSNRDTGRNRILFDAGGAAGGVQASRVLRDRRDGRQFAFTLKGTF